MLGFDQVLYGGMLISRRPAVKVSRTTSGSIWYPRVYHFRETRRIKQRCSGDTMEITSTSNSSGRSLMLFGLGSTLGWCDASAAITSSLERGIIFDACFDARFVTMKRAFELQTMHELEAWREAQDSKTT